jgi:hypothetical protein
MRNGAWLHHQKLVKTMSSSSIKALEGAARRSICAKCAHHPERSLKQWASASRPPDRLPASCLFSNIHRFKC